MAAILVSSRMDTEGDLFGRPQENDVRKSLSQIETKGMDKFALAGLFVGVAEGVIMRVGGWRTRSVFERYNIVSQADIRDALEKLELAQSAKPDPKFGHDFGHDSPKPGSDSLTPRIN